jgi:hypothetical protein
LGEHRIAADRSGLRYPSDLTGDRLPGDSDALESDDLKRVVVCTEAALRGNLLSGAATASYGAIITTPIVSDCTIAMRELP